MNTLCKAGTQLIKMTRACSIPDQRITIELSYCVTTVFDVTAFRIAPTILTSDRLMVMHRPTFWRSGMLSFQMKTVGSKT